MKKAARIDQRVFRRVQMQRMLSGAIYRKQYWPMTIAHRHTGAPAQRVHLLTVAHQNCVSKSTLHIMSTLKQQIKVRIFLFPIIISVLPLRQTRSGSTMTYRHI